jgi:hypothetical protein
MKGKTYNSIILGIGITTVIFALLTILNHFFLIPAVVGLLCMLGFGFTFQYDIDDEDYL